MASKGEECLAAALEADPVPGWDLVTQYRFHPQRKWSFDFAFPSQKLAVEVDGQRHRTYAGVRNDCEKFNTATLLGWRVLRFPSDQWRKAADWAALVREALCCPPPPSPPSSSTRSPSWRKRKGDPRPPSSAMH